MKREIKFRAWDERGQQIIDNEELQMNCDGFAAIDEEGTEFPMDVIMQYTGLKDRNGKEIYRGDVLRLYIPANDEIAEVEVFWDELQLRWATRYVKSPAIIDGNKSYTLPLCAFIHKKAEIIGNIYEDNNLLGR